MAEMGGDKQLHHPGGDQLNVGGKRTESREEEKTTNGAAYPSQYT